ncbi:platelet binding protein GspB-like [Littorina saxatilis]|uniref:Uncharacterized protein n=1 Tax=Littorina saxatilis TaxID=31220 RepID=A0AAN9B244_9CAEN
MASNTSGVNTHASMSPALMRDLKDRVHGTRSLERLSGLDSDKHPSLIFSGSRSGSFVKQRQAAFLRTSSMSSSQTSLNSVTSDRSHSSKSPASPTNSRADGVTNGLSRSSSTSLPRIPSKILKERGVNRHSDVVKSDQGQDGVERKVRRLSSQDSLRSSRSSVSSVKKVDEGSVSAVDRAPSDASDVVMRRKETSNASYPLQRSSTSDAQPAGNSSRPSSSYSERNASASSSRRSSFHSEKSASASSPRPLSLYSASNSRPSSSHSERNVSATLSRQLSAASDKDASASNSRPTSSHSERNVSATLSRRLSAASDKDASASNSRPTSSHSERNVSATLSRQLSAASDKDASAANSRPSSSHFERKASATNSRPTSFRSERRDSSASNASTPTGTKATTSRNSSFVRKDSSASEVTLRRTPKDRTKDGDQTSSTGYGVLQMSSRSSSRRSSADKTAKAEFNGGKHRPSFHTIQGSSTPVMQRPTRASSSASSSPPPSPPPPLPPAEETSSPAKEKSSSPFRPKSSHPLPTPPPTPPLTPDEYSKEVKTELPPLYQPRPPSQISAHPLPTPPPTPRSSDSHFSVSGEQPLPPPPPADDLPTPPSSPQLNSFPPPPPPLSRQSSSASSTFSSQRREQSLLNKSGSDLDFFASLPDTLTHGGMVDGRDVNKAETSAGESRTTASTQNTEVFGGLRTVTKTTTTTTKRSSYDELKQEAQNESDSTATAAPVMHFPPPPPYDPSLSPGLKANLVSAATSPMSQANQDSPKSKLSVSTLEQESRLTSTSTDVAMGYLDNALSGYPSGSMTPSTPLTPGHYVSASQGHSTFDAFNKDQTDTFRTSSHLNNETSASSTKSNSQEESQATTTVLNFNKPDFHSSVSSGFDVKSEEEERANNVTSAKIDSERVQALKKKKGGKAKRKLSATQKYEGSVKTVRRQIKPGHVEGLKEIFRKQDEEEEKLTLTGRRGKRHLRRGSDDEYSGSGYSTTSSDNEYDLERAERINSPDYSSSSPFSSPRSFNYDVNWEQSRASHNTTSSEDVTTTTKGSLGFDPENENLSLHAETVRSFGKGSENLSAEKGDASQVSEAEREPFMANSVHTYSDTLAPVPSTPLTTVDDFASSLPPLDLQDTDSNTVHVTRTERGRGSEQGDISTTPTANTTTTADLFSSLEKTDFKTRFSSPESESRERENHDSTSNTFSLPSLSDSDLPFQYRAGSDTTTTTPTTTTNITVTTNRSLRKDSNPAPMQDDANIPVTMQRETASPLADRREMIDVNYNSTDAKVIGEAGGEAELTTGGIEGGQSGLATSRESEGPTAIFWPNHHHHDDTNGGPAGRRGEGREEDKKTEKEEEDKRRAVVTSQTGRETYDFSTTYSSSSSSSRPATGRFTEDDEEEDIVTRHSDAEAGGRLAVKHRDSLTLEQKEFHNSLPDITTPSTDADQYATVESSSSLAENPQTREAGGGSDDFLSILDNIQLGSEGFKTETATRARQLVGHESFKGDRNRLSVEVPISETESVKKTEAEDKSSSQTSSFRETSIEQTVLQNDVEADVPEPATAFESSRNFDVKSPETSTTKPSFTTIRTGTSTSESPPTNITDDAKSVTTNSEENTDTKKAEDNDNEKKKKMASVLGELHSYNFQKSSKTSQESSSSAVPSSSHNGVEENAADVYVYRDRQGDVYVMQDVTDQPQASTTPATNAVLRTADEDSVSGAASFDFQGLNSSDSLTVDTDHVDVHKAKEVISAFLTDGSTARSMHEGEQLRGESTISMRGGQEHKFDMVAGNVGGRRQRVLSLSTTAEEDEEEGEDSFDGREENNNVGLMTMGGGGYAEGQASRQQVSKAGQYDSGHQQSQEYNHQYLPPQSAHQQSVTVSTTSTAVVAEETEMQVNIPRYGVQVLPAFPAYLNGSSRVTDANRSVVNEPLPGLNDFMSTLPSLSDPYSSSNTLPAAHNDYTSSQVEYSSTQLPHPPPPQVNFSSSQRDYTSSKAFHTPENDVPSSQTAHSSSYTFQPSTFESQADRESGAHSYSSRSTVDRSLFASDANVDRSTQDRSYRPADDFDVSRLRKRSDSSLSSEEGHAGGSRYRISTLARSGSLGKLNTSFSTFSPTSKPSYGAGDRVYDSAAQKRDFERFSKPMYASSDRIFDSGTSRPSLNRDSKLTYGRSGRVYESGNAEDKFNASFDRSFGSTSRLHDRSPTSLPPTHKTSYKRTYGTSGTVYDSATTRPDYDKSSSRVTVIHNVNAPFNNNNNISNTSFGENDSQYGSQTSKATSAGDMSPTDEHLYKIIRGADTSLSPSTTSPASPASSPLRQQRVSDRSTRATSDYQQRELNRSHEAIIRQQRPHNDTVDVWRVGSFSRSQPDLNLPLLSKTLSSLPRSGDEEQVDDSRAERYKLVKTGHSGQKVRTRRSSSSDSESDSGVEGGKRYRTVSRVRVQGKERSNSTGSLADARYSRSPSPPARENYRVSQVQRQTSWDRRQEPSSDAIDDHVYRVNKVTSSDDLPRDLNQEPDRKVGFRTVGDVGFHDNKRQSWSSPRASGDENNNNNDNRPYKVVHTQPSEKSSHMTDERGIRRTRVQATPGSRSFDADLSPRRGHRGRGGSPERGDQHRTVISLRVNEGHNVAPTTHYTEAQGGQYRVTNVKPSDGESGRHADGYFSDGHFPGSIKDRPRDTVYSGVFAGHNQSFPSPVSGYESDLDRSGTSRMHSVNTSPRHAQRPVSPAYDNSPRGDRLYVVNSTQQNSPNNRAFVEEERVSLREVRPRVASSPPPSLAHNRSFPGEWHKTSLDINRNFNSSSSTRSMPINNASNHYSNPRTMAPLHQQQSKSYVVFNSMDNIRDQRHDTTHAIPSLQRSNAGTRAGDRHFRVTSPVPSDVTTGGYRSGDWNLNSNRTRSHHLTARPEIIVDDTDPSFRREVWEEKKTYEMRTDMTTHVMPEGVLSEEEKDLRVLRGKILIKNRMDDSRDQDDFLHNMNIFDTSFHMDKDNPLYQSDPDIYKSLEEELRQQEQHSSSIGREVTQDITYETVDRIAKKHREGNVEMSPKPRHKKQNLSSMLLSKLATIDSKDIHQHIDVQHHNEEIYGDVHLIHADGTKAAAGNTSNFDSVHENVELMLKQGKAFVVIKVIAERIVPIDYEFNVWRKSQAIVTRNIEIDLKATEQRRRLYEHVMETGGRMPCTVEGSGGYDDDYGAATYRSAGPSGQGEQERQLTSLETLRLFSTILDVSEGKGDVEDREMRTRQEMGRLGGSREASAMDLLY